MTVAATTGPTPEQPGQAGAGRPDRDGELLPGLAQLGVDAAQVLDKGRGQLAAGGRNRVRRCDRLIDPDHHHRHEWPSFLVPPVKARGGHA